MNTPLLSLVKPPKRFPRIPAQKLPARVWQTYLDILRVKIIAQWRKKVEELIIAKLPYIERQVENERPGGLRKDSWSDDAAIQLSLLSDQYDKIAQQSKDIAAGTFEAVNGVSHRQWYDIAQRVLGVNLFQHEPWLEAESKAFVHVNVDLVTNLQESLQSDISRIVMGGFREGKRWESLRDELLGTKLDPGVFDKVDTRAKLIARDQTTKLYADVGEKRQVNAGLTLYIWRTMEDERVVGTPGGRWPKGSEGHHNHYLMDGKVCKWSDPTVYADSVELALAGKWKKRTAQMPEGATGKEIQCRCYAGPVFQTLFQKTRGDSIDIRKDAAHGWIGYDIDATLAKYDFSVHGLQPIGEPIPRMVSRLKRDVGSGKICKYFTARARSPEGVQDVRDWALKNGLPNLEVTNVKDHSMIILYDDRARQVEPNTGKVVGE